MLKAVAQQSAQTLLLTDSYPFIVPSSGSVTVTTGVLTLTTALDRVYAKSYMYFPAGAWTGSTAGFYYVTMSSTTSGLVYSNKYVSGIPSTPTSPTLVTTGAGAYTQTTATYLAGQIYTVPAGVMGLNGTLYTEVVCSAPATANFKYLQLVYGGNTFSGIGLTSSTTAAYMCKTTNNNATNSQSSFYYNGINGGGYSSTAVDTTLTTTQQVNYYLATATDYLVSQWVSLQVLRN